MKRFDRILSSLLAVCMVLSLLDISAAADSGTAPVPTSLALSAETSSMVRLPTDDNANTITYSATLEDQYGDAMSTPTENVNWSITPSNAHVTVNNGVVSVAKGAAEGTYTLTATCGELTASADFEVVEKSPRSLRMTVSVTRS